MPQTAANPALIQSLKDLPAQQIVVGRLLAMLDDENARVTDLAQAIESDPALSTQVMRLANSPFNGLMQQVDSAARAVTVLGFTTVRTLAMSTACGLNGGGRATPSGFWVHSVTVAAASAIIAERCRLDGHAAFSAGLLHDLGIALLFRHDPGTYAEVLLVDPDESDRVAGELEAFGMSHEEVGATVLEASRFPVAFIDAIAQHHRPFDQIDSDLGRAVWAGERLSALMGGGAGAGDERGRVELVDALGAMRCQTAVDHLVEHADSHFDKLSAFLTTG